MSSIIQGYEYDIFISYRQKDNKYDGWVTEFVNNLRKELEATFKEEISIYFDENPHDGILETYSIDKSLENKINCLIFIPIISQTYCDPKSFAWREEFLSFARISQDDSFGRHIKLTNGNVASRILPIRIHDLDPEDNLILEKVLNEPVRSIEFIYREQGVNRPLTPADDEKKNLNNTRYRNQINKVANSVKEIIVSLNKQGSDLNTYDKSSAFAKKTENKRPYKKIVTALVFLVFLLISYFSISRMKKSTADHARSIAILPFKLLSNEADKQYLADGMMEAVLLNLQKFSDLRVMPRTSVEQYRSTLKRANVIGKELDVEYLLEGSFQKDGNNARLTVHLINAGKEKEAWGHEYKRNWQDIFSVQSDVAQDIAAELHTIITPEEKELIERAPTHDLSAYELYLKANKFSKDFSLTRSESSHKKAATFYKAALEIDSTFDKAYTGLAMLYIENNYLKEYLNENFLDSCDFLADKALSFNDQSEEAYFIKGAYSSEKGDAEKAIDFIDKAIKINPNYLDAYSIKGQILVSFENDYVKGIENFQKALSLIRDKTRPSLLTEVGNVYSDVGFFEKAKNLNSEALDLSKDSASYYILSATIEFEDGNIDQAISLNKKANRIDSTYLMGLDWLTLTPNHQGEALKQTRRAINFFKKTGFLNLHGSHRVGYVLSQAGMKKEADPYFRQEIKYCEESIKLGRIDAHTKSSQYDLAATYSFLGERDKAYKYLDDFIKRKFFPSWWIILIKYDPLFENIRNEDRFQKIIKEVADKNKLEHDRVADWLAVKKS